MACELHVVQLDTDSAPHDQEITFHEAEFNPKACICLTAMDTSINTREGSAIWMRGFWAEGDQQHCYTGQKNDGTNGEAHRENESGSISIKYNATGTLKEEFNIKSIVAGTCTIEITTSQHTGPYVILFFIDAEEACVGTDITPDSTGNDTITHANLDFTPNCIFFSGDQNDALNEFEGSDTEPWFGFSAGSGSSDELSISMFGDDAGSGIDSQLNQSYAMHMRSHNTTRTEATNVSMGASEFVMDFDTKPDTPKYFMFLALKLDNVYVENNEATSSGTSPDQEITGVGFQPQGVMFLSGNHTAFDADKGHVGVVNGFATDEATDRNAGLVLTGKASSPENMERRTDDATAFRTISTNGGTAENVGTVSAWDADGFDIDWSTASTKKFGFIALSHTPGAAASASSAVNVHPLPSLLPL